MPRLRRGKWLGVTTKITDCHATDGFIQEHRHSHYRHHGNHFLGNMCPCMEMVLLRNIAKINRQSKTIVTMEHIDSWPSYQIRKIAGCACAGNDGNVFPRRRFQRKPLVSDPGMHHGTRVTHVPWCMSGSLTRGDRENVPGIPGACAPTILRIWQEAH